MGIPKNYFVYFDFYREPKSPFKTPNKNRCKDNTKKNTIDIFR
jgi:hypothetical protein